MDCIKLKYIVIRKHEILKAELTHFCAKRKQYTKYCILTVHGHFIDLRGVKLLNVAQNSDVVILHEVNGYTLASKSTRATDPESISMFQVMMGRSINSSPIITYIRA